MDNKSAENYLDELLNSLNGTSEDEGIDSVEEKIEEPIFEEEPFFEEETVFPEEPVYEEPAYEEPAMFSEDPMTEDELDFAAATDFAENFFGTGKNSSRKDSAKSEADFLMEFEAELNGDEYNDFLKEFSEDNQIVEEDRMDITPEDALFSMLGEESTEELGGFESIEDEIPNLMMQEDSDGTQEIAFEDLFGSVQPEEKEESEESGEDIADAFASLFGNDSIGDANDADNGVSPAEAIDLTGMGEEDLLSLLSGTDDLSDIGDLLSKGDGLEPIDGLDAFAAFAENEMSGNVEGVSAETGDKSKNKKGGFLEKLSTLLFGSDEDEESDVVDFSAANAPSAEELSDENAQILASLTDDGASAPAENGKKGKKEKKKKEKKEKKKKEPKAKKPKVPKPPKPPKEKKPKVVDNTPPLPKGPVFMIWLFALSLLALVYLGTNLIGYTTDIREAKHLFNGGHYVESYEIILGHEIKEKDMEFYNQVATLSTVDSELTAYRIFYKNDKFEAALDSLVCAAGRCEINAENAEIFECVVQMESMRKDVEFELKDKYKMTYDEAMTMYRMKDRDDYSIAIHMKLKELGLK